MTAEETDYKLLKIALVVAVLVGFLGFPTVFCYGIFGILVLGFTAGAWIHLAAVFKSRASRELCWGQGSRYPMSRRSRFLVGAFFGLGAAYLVVRVLVKPANTHYLFAALMCVMLLTAGSGWLDRRRPR